MTPEEKKERILQLIEDKLRESSRGVRFSSPTIIGARIYLLSNEPLPLESSEAKRVTLTEEPSKEDNSTHNNPYLSEIDEAAIEAEIFADADVENMTPKQKKQFEKDLEKAKKKAVKDQKRRQERNKKAFDKMRKDAKNRGFGTGVLYELDDPADIYDLTNDEITQIEMASVVNADGYYNFVYPFDYETVHNDRINKRTLFVFLGFFAAIALLSFILINSISGITR